jgi:serine/threonine protein kinase
MPDKDPLHISGQVVAEKYRIEHLAGEGGFAVVYVAEHTIWKQPVAVKFFSGLSQAPAEYREELLQQFFQEGALLTELSSQTAGIVQARDVGAYTTPAGQWLPFMVLEWLDGTPLDAILAEDQRLGQAWTEGEVVGFLRRILPILDVAHRRGITHRDIKPANIFIMGSDVRAPGTPCKLLDFGVAKIVSEHAKVSAALAKTGVAITSFTPRYGAPEQFTRSYGATGPWTDVYSVALLACEMLTGRVALEGEDLVQFGFSSANPTRRPTPRFLGARVSDQLEGVFAKALAVRPEDRFQHAGEFLEGVERGVPAPTQAAPSTSLQLAPTLLVRVEDRTMTPATAKLAAAKPATAKLATTLPAPPSPATTKPVLPSPATAKPELPSPKTAKPESPPAKEDASGLGSLIFMLVVLVGGFVAYSMTDLRGAREVRAFFSPVARLVRKEVAQQLPKLREKTREVMDNAADILAGTAPACPPGTRLVTSVPPHAPEAHSGSGEHGPNERVCVEEHLVSEIDYSKCAVCEQPKGSRPKSAQAKSAQAKRKIRRHAEFCIDGKTPRTDPIRCATWKQADIYCAALAARLPTEDELHALPPTLVLSPMEWTSVTPEADRENRGRFRCAHDQ